MNQILRRMFNLWRGSTLQVIAAIVIPLTLLLVAISFGSFFIHQSAMRTMVGERDERAVRGAANAIESEITHRKGTLHGLALLAQDGSKDSLDKALADSNYLLEDYDSGLAFISRENKLLSYSGQKSFWETIPGQLDPSIWKSQEYQGVTTLNVNGKLIILVSYLPQGGETLTLGAFSASKLFGSILEKDFPQNGNAAVYIFDPQFHIVFQSGPGTIEGDPAHHPGIPEALDGQSGATYVQSGSDEHVLAFSPIRVMGWAIVIEESWEAVASPTLQTSQITPMILVPALLLAMLALWFGGEKIVKPLRALEAKAARLSWGDFNEIEQPVQGIAEIRHLQTELAHMARRVQAAQQSLHSYIGAITRGQEDERQRLARELHDDTIQSLIALKQRAQLTRLALPKDASPKALTELEELTEQTIEDLRRTIRALRPIYLEDLGLVAALEMLSNEAGQNTHLKIEMHVSGHEQRFPADVELALYRMVQEALNNVIHHAQAKRVTIELAFTAQALNIQITDDGIGFNVPKSPAEFAPNGHFGLLGLYERAQLIGAQLDIQSTPRTGTKLSICLSQKAENSKQ